MFSPLCDGGLLLQVLKLFPVEFFILWNPFWNINNGKTKNYPNVSTLIVGNAWIIGSFIVFFSEIKICGTERVTREYNRNDGKMEIKFNAPCKCSFHDIDVVQNKRIFPVYMFRKTKCFFWLPLHLLSILLLLPSKMSLHRNSVNSTYLYV